MTVETAVFTCSICGEPSAEICVNCTKDACANHRCDRCKRCSDCCECEVPLSAAEVHVPDAAAVLVPEVLSDVVPEPSPEIPPEIAAEAALPEIPELHHPHEDHPDEGLVP